MSDPKYPIGYSLIGIFAVCAIIWAVTLIFHAYAGAASLVIGALCALALLVIRIRKAFAFGPRYAADFVSGKTQSRNTEGRFCNPKKAALEAQLAAENRGKAEHDDEV